MSAMKKASVSATVTSLPAEMLANIHGRLSLLDRLAFAAVFSTLRDEFKTEAPCLFLPGSAPENATLFSLAERRAAAVRSPGLGHLVLSSSSRGWLITADGQAQLRLVNPVTGERRALPAIDTIPCLDAHNGHSHFTSYKMWFLRGPSYCTMTMDAQQVRLFLYRKVVLSDSAAVAMLITGPQFGVAAFAMAGGGVWRLALPHDGVKPVAKVKDGMWRLRDSGNGIEDAIHHKGRFCSITYSGEVEAWEERDTDAPGVFTSVVIAPRLLLPADSDHRKYLVAAPDGRLMVVLKETMGRWSSPSFKVQVLDAGGKGWKETDDIGEAALFVGGSGSLCVSTEKHAEFKAGCVYYTEEGHQDFPDGHCKSVDRYYIGVRGFSLKDGSWEKVQGLGRHWTLPWPTWFTPSIL